MFRIFILLIILLLQLNLWSQDLVILHTNDVHSRIEPMPKNSSVNANQGGFVRQAAYIKEVQEKNPLVLVLNSGDMVQGTTYFNIFKGKVEIELMNAIGYDAACIGNHEFDNGMSALATMIKQAKFPIISSNYDFSNTPLEGLTKEYLIIKRNKIKIGIIGIGVDPEGLISHSNYEGMKYLPPVETANKLAKYLKEKKKCDIVICLSHLGYFPAENQMGDITLAKQSKDIDIILGGHSHTLLKNPEKVLNSNNKEVTITQMGKNGIFVGRLDVTLGKQ